MKKTTEECINLVKETIQYYSEDVGRRAVLETGACVYSDCGVVPKKCAVGRCMTDSAISEFGKVQGDVGILCTQASGNHNEQSEDLDHLLEDRYKGFPFNLWNALQMLHDNSNNWDENGLSDIGREAEERIIDNINYYY